MSGTSVVGRAMSKRRSRFTAHWWFWNIVPALPLPIFFYLKLEELSKKQSGELDSRPQSVSGDANPLVEDEQGPPSGLGSQTKWKHWLEWRLQSQAEDVKELQRRILGIEGALRETLPGLDAKLPPVPFQQREAPPKLTPPMAPSDKFLEAAKGYILTGVSEIQEHITRFVGEVMGQKKEESAGASTEAPQPPLTERNEVSGPEESDEKMQMTGSQQPGRSTIEAGGTTGSLSEGCGGRLTEAMHMEGSGVGVGGVMPPSGELQVGEENSGSESEKHKPSLYRRAIAGIVGLPGRLYRYVRPGPEDKSKE